MMSETERNEAVEAPVTERTEDSVTLAEKPAETDSQEAEEHYEYRWSYAAQRAFDEETQKKKRKRGGWTYAITMAAAFLICFSMLAGVLVWYEVTGRSKRAYSSLTVGEVSAIVSPSTVLIYSYDSTNSGTSGTGFFISSDGYIATNCHVVRNLDNHKTYKYFEVTLYSAERIKAELVGFNEEYDLAVLKIQGNSYPAVTVGDSNAVRVGDTAIVIGHPNGAHGAWTTTQGIISAINRPKVKDTKQRMLQTDAAVNPGNSGGPLCNDRAEVIGVMTQIMLDGTGNRSEGFGMAIPINKAMEILDQIIEEAD